MRDIAKTLDAVLRQIMAGWFPVVALGLMWLILVALANALGFGLRGWRAMSPTELAYLAGAVWLLRKAAGSGRHPTDE